jgi:uncharacterized protein CbrC (UPF0167 family)
MERLTISCDSCERLWTLGCALSIYEQQSLEARPCPHCGAYTLSVHMPEVMIRASKTRVRNAAAS